MYVYGEQVKGWYSVDERSPEVHRGEDERAAGDVPHQLAEAGAAYANVGDAQARRRRAEDSRQPTADSRQDEDAGD
jgi:hypothetical protein